MRGRSFGNDSVMVRASGVKDTCEALWGWLTVCSSLCFDVKMIYQGLLSTITSPGFIQMVLIWPNLIFIRLTKLKVDDDSDYYLGQLLVVPCSASFGCFFWRY